MYFSFLILDIQFIYCIIPKEEVLICVYVGVLLHFRLVFRFVLFYNSFYETEIIFVLELIFFSVRSINHMHMLLLFSLSLKILVLFNSLTIPECIVLEEVLS
jgi:hypothetical protein